jgi:hypothetical protein
MPRVDLERVDADVVKRVFFGKQVGAERGKVVNVQVGRRQVQRFEKEPQRLILVFAVERR